MTVYSNLFVIEKGDVVRLMFSDERAKKNNMPASQTLQAEIIMTVSNAEALHSVLGKVLGC
jgi:hypothetical protein